MLPVVRLLVAWKRPVILVGFTTLLGAVFNHTLIGLTVGVGIVLLLEAWSAWMETLAK